MKRIGSLVAASAATAVLAATGPAWAATTTPASAPLPCHASMSNYHPKDYTTTYVHVRTTAYASVTTVAHYKTVNRKHTGKAGVKGNATIRWSPLGLWPLTPLYLGRGATTPEQAPRIQPRGLRGRSG